MTSRVADKNLSLASMGNARLEAFLPAFVYFCEAAKLKMNQVNFGQRLFRYVCFRRSWKGLEGKVYCWRSIVGGNQAAMLKAWFSTHKPHC